MNSARQRNNLRLASMYLQRNIVQAINDQETVKIFPFQITEGAVNLTETGYKPLNARITDFGHLERIFTGQSPVVAKWKGSEYLVKANDTDQFYTRTQQVGDYWEGKLVSDISSVNISSVAQGTSIFSKDYSTMSTSRTYTIYLGEELFTANDELQFFVVMRNNGENLIQANIDDSHGWLFLANVINWTDQYTGKVLWQQLIFASVNDKISATGQQINGFIQPASMGDSYAFPLVLDGKVYLNKLRLRAVGVKYVSLNVSGISMINNIGFFGRPILAGQNPTILEGTNLLPTKVQDKVLAPRRVFIAGDNNEATNEKHNGGVMAAIQDEIKSNSRPSMLWVELQNAEVQYANGLEFGDYLQGLFTPFTNRNVDLVVNPNDTDGTTKDHTNKYKKAFLDSQWVIPQKASTYDIQPNPNFRYKEKDTGNVYSVINDTFDMNSLLQHTITESDETTTTGLWVNEILNWNSLIFSTTLQLPLNLEQYTVWSLKEIPIIGHMISFLFGNGAGFMTTQNSEQLGKMPYISAFMDYGVWEKISETYSQNDGTTDIQVFKDAFPLAFLDSSQVDSLGAMLGAQTTTLGLTMKLSDRLNIKPLDANGTKIDQYETISSVDLSQKKNDKIYVLDYDTQFVDQTYGLTTPDTDMQWNPTSDGLNPEDPTGYSFVIEAIQIQAVGMTNYAFTAYSQNPFKFVASTGGQDISDISVARYVFQSNAKYTTNMLNWTDFYLTGSYITDESTFDYPADILPPSPNDIAKDVVIDLTSEVITNGIPSTANDNRFFEAGTPEDNPILIGDQFSTNSGVIKSTFNTSTFTPKVFEYNWADLGFPQGLQITSFERLWVYFKNITISYTTTSPTTDNLQYLDKGGLNVDGFNYSFYDQGLELVYKSGSNILTSEIIIGQDPNTTINQQALVFGNPAEIIVGYEDKQETNYTANMREYVGSAEYKLTPSTGGTIDMNLNHYPLGDEATTIAHYVGILGGNGDVSATRQFDYLQSGLWFQQTDTGFKIGFAPAYSVGQGVVYNYQDNLNTYSMSVNAFNYLTAQISNIKITFKAK